MRPDSFRRERGIGLQGRGRGHNVCATERMVTAFHPSRTPISRAAARISSRPAIVRLLRVSFLSDGILLRNLRVVSHSGCVR